LLLGCDVGRRKGVEMRKVLATAVLVIGMAATPAVALAAPPSNPSCFGAGVSQLGSAGEMGAHSSGFAGSRRLGIGNVAELLTGTHQPGELAGLLGADCS
jgi:hypothetical protein